MGFSKPSCFKISSVARALKSNASMILQVSRRPAAINGSDSCAGFVAAIIIVTDSQTGFYSGLFDQLSEVPRGVRLIQESFENRNIAVPGAFVFS